MTPGAAALCPGRVFHRRLEPQPHDFAYPVSYVWLDPDDPHELFDRHPLWSARRAAPARFRVSDYGDGSERSLTDQVRDDLAGVLGHRPNGPVRLLTQVRRWGWLFNPITVFVAWGEGGHTPVGVVLEVTNTPWKERYRYPAPLRAVDGAFSCTIRKVLHVSPFLGEDYEYLVRIADLSRKVELDIDVVGRASGDLVLRTGMRLDRVPATRSALSRALVREPLPTHRVSAGIHAHAARLWRKRVPFVAHPAKRSTKSVAEDARGCPVIP